MKRVVKKEEEQKFIGDVLNFISEKGWTIENVQDATEKVVVHMKKNAVLKEEPMQETSALE